MPMCMPAATARYIKKCIILRRCLARAAAARRLLARESARQRRRTRSVYAPITHFVSHALDSGAADVVLARGKSAMGNRPFSLAICVCV